MTNRNILTGQHTKNVWILLLLLILLLTNNHSWAHIRLPQVLASHMVLQQRSAAAFWGWADPGEKVYITPSWNGKKDSVITDGNGKWKLMVQTPAAGGPFSVLLKGNNQILLENIMVGEVWICSGQSNMEMNYFWGLPQMKEDFKESNNSNIRFFHIP
ncbi:MAG: sialate O-acetylesterase, partial [Flavisolibacter sp.]